MTNDVIEERRVSSAREPAKRQSELIIEVAPARPQAPVWMERAELQLEKIERLPADWDHMNAARPSPAAIDDAAAFLFRFLPTTDVSLPKPSIDPTRSGGIDLVWEIGSRYLGLEIQGDGQARYLFEDVAEHVSEEDTVLLDEELDIISQLLQKLVAPAGELDH